MLFCAFAGCEQTTGGGQTTEDGSQTTEEDGQTSDCNHVSLTHHDAVEATCTEDGKIEYWKCEECGKYFADAEGKSEITLQQTIVGAKGHIFNHIAALAPTCSEKGHIEYWQCLVCGKYYADEEAASEITIEDTQLAAGHTFEDGICTVCGVKEPTQGLVYQLNSDGKSYSVVGIGTATDKDIVIADIYEGLPVTNIATQVFYYNKSITSVNIPNSVTSIESKAFGGCSNLTNIVIPDSVSYISDYAFANCFKLIISCEVESKPSDWGVNWNAGSCSVIWDCNNNDIAYDGYRYVVIDGVRYGIKDNAAKVIGNINIIGDIEIPLGVEYGGLLYSVTSIEKYAFSDCTGLTGIVIPDSVVNIGEYAFNNCTGMTRVEIPDSVTTIKNGAFFTNNSTTDVYYTGDLEGWCNISFEDSFSNPMRIAKNIYIKGELLQGELIIPDSITKIKNYTFYGCKSLTGVVFPDSVTSIGNFAFAECEGFTSLTIGNSVTNIGKYAFSMCSNITSIVIPDSVTSIEGCAFLGCSDLRGTIIPDSVTSMGYHVFFSCRDAIIYCEAESKPSGWDNAWYFECTVAWGYKG